VKESNFWNSGNEDIDQNKTSGEEVGVVEDITINEAVDDGMEGNKENCLAQGNATFNTETDPVAPPKIQSQLAMARYLLDNKRIEHVPRLGSFTVVGSKGDTYSVKLFPKEKCQCPSTARCYHIIAALMSVGAYEPEKKRTINLTQLKVNSRKRLDKKSGTKKPRAADVDIEPAPDSTANLSKMFDVFGNDTDHSAPLGNISIISHDAIQTSTPHCPGKSCLASPNGLKTPKTPKRKVMFNKSSVRKKLKLESDNHSVNNCTSPPVISNVNVHVQQSVNSPVHKPVTTNSVNNSVNNSSNSHVNVHVQQSVNSPVHKPVTSNSVNNSVNISNNSSVNTSVQKSSANNISINNSVNSSVNTSKSKLKLKKHSKNVNKESADKKDKFNSYDNAVLGNIELSSDILETVHQILIQQFPLINGFQSTLLVPVFSDKCNKWEYNNMFESRTAPTAQIHHNGQGHWVVSVKSTEKGRLYVLDSLYHQNLSSSLDIQLAKIYGCGKKKLVVHVPHTQQQSPGTVDCGVFAVANIVEFCINGFKELDQLSHNWNFNMSLAREHLKSCLQQQQFTPFPKVYLAKEQFMNVDRHNIDLFCTCSLPETFGDMVSCDRCNMWYHQGCLGKTTFNSPWCCSSCQSKRPRKKPFKLVNM
jgi:hypothetical protein